MSNNLNIRTMETNIEVCDFKIGDTIRNTTNGFIFEVLEMKHKLHGLKVKNLITGKITNTTYENMEKLQSDNTPMTTEVQILHDLIVAEREDVYFPMTEEENAVLYKYRNLICKAMIKYKKHC